jgi:hypothetical protein
MRVRIAIAGQPDRVAELSRALEPSGTETIRLESPPTDGSSESTAGLTVPLLAFEPQLNGTAGGPIAAVVLADASDVSLAAALVAAKVPLPLVWIESPGANRSPAETLNARVIERLAVAAASRDPAAILVAIERASSRMEPGQSG